ncbi:MAG: 2-hydroxychromene-2-carboxylate isomerase [Alphaproteobacteria bacterium]|nr:2-hydroxychromene-2-carboxylate isomerase [Alphaproteobacteria bacterium]
MSREIEFYFDCSSPWTYLGFHAVQPLAAELNATILWKPILVGGVFNAVNQSVYDNRANPNPLKHTYMLKDLGDWARLYGLTIRFPPTVFPVNSVKCMRASLHALDRGRLVPFATAAFEAYWAQDRDLSQDEVLADIASQAGLEWGELRAALAGETLKARLRANTEELIARGGFGSPTMFVGGDLYFGNDRLPLVRAALLAR